MPVRAGHPRARGHRRGRPRGRAEAGQPAGRRRLHDRRRAAALGVRRISVGGALARAAWGGFLAAAREIAAQGTFTALARATPFAEIDGTFASRGGDTKPTGSA